ncbi:MAG: hypothetical protein ABSG78_05285 [Verrucomicrobiota bacterium]|jgi:hypothetical protein
MRFSQQRGFGFTVFLILAAEIVCLHLAYAGQMPHLSYLTGWALLAVILLLAIYNARKKLPFLPLLSSEAWLQFHIYAGLLTGVLFAVHVSYKIPAGWFQGVLAWLYLLVMASGFFGLFLSRTIPRRLTTRGGEVLFERIPSIRRQIQEQAEQLALQSAGESKSDTIAGFYLRELKDFFNGSKNRLSHWSEDGSPLNHILTKISDVQRYLNEQERATLEKIAVLVRQKDALDYHYAQQFLLKAWLFVHIPLTYSLLLFAVVHIILVFAYSGGAP